MSDCCFGCIIWCLGLRNIDDRARHGSNHNHAALNLSLHEVARNGGGKEVSSINIHTPELPHAIRRVGNGVKIFSEASGGDEMVNLPMVSDNLGSACIDRLGI